MVNMKFGEKKTCFRFVKRQYVTKLAAETMNSPLQLSLATTATAYKIFTCAVLAADNQHLSILETYLSNCGDVHRMLQTWINDMRIPYLACRGRPNRALSAETAAHSGLYLSPGNNRHAPWPDEMTGSDPSSSPGRSSPKVGKPLSRGRLLTEAHSHKPPFDIAKV